MVFPFTV